MTSIYLRLVLVIIIFTGLVFFPIRCPVYRLLLLYRTVIYYVDSRVAFPITLCCNTRHKQVEAIISWNYFSQFYGFSFLPCYVSASLSAASRFPCRLSVLEFRLCSSAVLFQAIAIVPSLYRASKALSTIVTITCPHQHLDYDEWRKDPTTLAEETSSKTVVESYARW